MKSLIKRVVNLVGLGIYLDVFLLNRRNEKGELQASFERMRNFYSKFLRERDMVFDVGANLGNYTKVFSDISCRVIAIEPQSYCMRFMKIRFGSNPNAITFVNKGLDSKEGKTVLHVSDSHTLSSMSDNWIKAVKQSGRFTDQSWSNKVEVEVTTLDHLIAEYGLPVYCKIDVEGFELNVLKGLTQPLSFISFEFTFECFDAAVSCIEHICSLSEYHFNFVKGDYEGFELEEFVPQSEFLDFLKRFCTVGSMGDIVARVK